jgi:succinate-semialdehyde dehydrogenase/glutarate-semialdehyde dehydrogenase
VRNNFNTVNPATGLAIRSYDYFNDGQFHSLIDLASKGYQVNKNRSFSEIAAVLLKMIELIHQRKQQLAVLCAQEMGKPVQEAIYELEKCASYCEYIAKNGFDFLQPETLEYTKPAFITKSPVGVVLGIMPWNYPFWQVFRFAIPAIAAGNAAILKHAPNVTGCALAIEQVFTDAGWNSGEFQVGILNNDQTKQLILHPTIQRISFTGSDQTGYFIASIAGSVGKKCVLELGGSDPFIVFKDADLHEVVEQAIKARFINAGQSCISAKRFIVHRDILIPFKELVLEKIKKLSIGNPLEGEFNIGPLARKDLQEKLIDQINRSIHLGCKTAYQSEVPNNGFFVPITVFDSVLLSAPVWKEEIFGPVFVVVPFSTEEEAIQLANDTQYGLGASIWTKDFQRGFQLAQRIDAGNVYINEMVKSDFPLPFGGTKSSGFGKELSKAGMEEFLNLRTTIMAKS